MLSLPHLGHGVGLRTEHYREVLADPPHVDWFEAITENFMVPGGNPRRVLRAVRERWPVVLHGVSLSIGSTDPLDLDYLDALAALAHEIEPAWISDHLSWGGVDGINAHDLLPLPYTEEALTHVITRVCRVQDRLGRRILLENPSSYVTFAESTMPEHQFLAAVAEQADCGILLDVNNVYVSAANHGFDPHEYLAGLPAGRVGQFHLAGHRDMGDWLLDSHDHPVPEAVWPLYREAVQRFGAHATLIEWDAELPPLATVIDEARRAAREEAAALSAPHSGERSVMHA